MSDTAPSQSGLNILVIDSDRAFHDLANAAAARIPGAQILCCRNPGEAIHRLDQFVPTLIVVDGLLNGAAGINFVKRVRAGHTPTPDGTLVVFVARDFTGGLSGRMCEAGCHGIVRKPMSVDGLVRALARTLTSPVPFVIGGSYLGPDRRAPGETGTHTPERRRTPARGGWTGTPALFYRPDQPRPAVRGPGAAARPSGQAPTRPSAAIVASGSGSATPAPAGPAQVLPAVASAPAAAAAPRGSPGLIEPASPQRPQVRPAVREIEPAGPQRAPARPAARELEPTVPQRPPGRPAVREIEPAAQSVAPPSADNGFDLDAAVRQHREWMASNGTSGARANLAGLSLAGAVLKGQNLAKANLRGTNLMNADLRSSVLVDADLRNACLAQALMDEAQLAGAKIRHADLQFAKLPTAGLQGSDLAGADLRGAILAGADLAGANLLGTNVRGADLTALNLTQKQLDRALGDATTQLPPGLFVGRSDT